MLSTILWGFTFKNSSINEESESKGLAVGGFVKEHLSYCFCVANDLKISWNLGLIRHNQKFNFKWKALLKCICNHHSRSVHYSSTRLSIPKFLWFQYYNLTFCLKYKNEFRSFRFISIVWGMHWKQVLPACAQIVVCTMPWPTVCECVGWMF